LVQKHQRGERLSNADCVWYNGSSCLTSVKPCCLVGGGRWSWFIVVW
jgi:hypothetical protein